MRQIASDSADTCFIPTLTPRRPCTIRHNEEMGPLLQEDGFFILSSNIVSSICITFQYIIGNGPS